MGEVSCSKNTEVTRQGNNHDSISKHTVTFDKYREISPRTKWVPS